MSGVAATAHLLLGKGHAGGEHGNESLSTAWRRRGSPADEEAVWVDDSWQDHFGQRWREEFVFS